MAESGDSVEVSPLSNSESYGFVSSSGPTGVPSISQQAKDKPFDRSTIDAASVASKRFLKRQARHEEWERTKKLKRKLQKEKRKQLGLPNKCKGGGKRRRRFKKMAESSRKTHIVVDMSFDELMIPKDRLRCANQVNRCYSVNRSLPDPFQFHVTSFGGLSKEAVSKQIGFENWDVMFHEESYDTIFEKDKIVYLTSDSKNVLSTVDEDKVYVIGGLVDHNSKKGLCHLLAEEKGIQHARLPLQEYIDMKTRNVLSINQVFSILAHVAQGKSWKDSILLSIPPRKNARAKGNDDDGSEEDECNNEVDCEAVSSEKGEASKNDDHVNGKCKEMLTEIQEQDGEDL